MVAISNMLFCKPIFNQWAGAYINNFRRDLFFVGDSIAWGYGVTQDQAFPRKVQQSINANLSHADAGWVVRNITTDDWTSGSTTPTGPFNGGLSGSPKLTTNSVTQGATGPLGGYQGNKSGGGPLYTEPAIRLDAAGDWIAADCSNATYFILSARCVGTSGGCTVTGTSNTSYAKSYDMTPGQYARHVFGPFTDATNVKFELTLKSGDAVIDVETIHPTKLYPSTFLNVHVNARNSYAIADFLSKTNDIKESAVHRVGYPFEDNAQPIFVLALGSVSIYDPTRQVSPTTYASQLTTLATSLSSGDYPGQVVLTIPPVPTGAWTATSGFTHTDFANAIVGVANNLGLYYIDFTSTLLAGDYLADGVNPNDGGHTKLANLYVSSLIGSVSGISFMTGTAAGAATVLGSSSSGFVGVAIATGSAVVSGVSPTINSGVAASAGTSTVQATSQTLVRISAVGASAGTATVNGQARWPGTYVSGKRRTLMFVGDSITWGFGVTQAQAYPALLQARTDTASTPAGSTSLWTARNVHADDIIVNDPLNPRDGVSFKLTNDTSAGGSVGFDNNGPFNSLFSSTISPTYGPAILLNSLNDGVIVSPSSPTRFFTVMVKVEGSGTATLKGYNASGVEIPDLSGSGGNATVGNTNLITTNVYRFIFDASTTSSAFLLRRVDANSSVNVRLLTVNPTNSYPSSNYAQIQINARGSYVFSDYARTSPSSVDNVPLIVDTIIHPQSEAGGPNTHPIFVIALGTVSIYHNPIYPSSYDRRITPAQYQTDLSYLVARIKAALPNAPIVLTHPPIPNTSTWITAYPRADYDAAVLNVASANQLFRVDLRPVLTNSDYITGDDIHPTAAGHIKLRDAYISALGL